MASIKIKLGELISISEDKNSENLYSVDDVKGISIQKKFIETKADMDGVSLRPYLLVKPDDFAYVTVTSRNGEKITLAHNTSDKTYIVSSSYIVFRVIRPDVLLSDYLFMYFNRPEFDRYSRFNSWGSARETFSWEEMCDIDIELPPIEIQRKYVEIYKGMLDNQIAYETGLEDLKLVCDGYIEDLKRKYTLERLECYLERTNIKNSDNKIKNVKNVSVYKTFNEPTAKVNKNELSGYKIVKPNEISFVQTTHNEKVFAFAINNTEDDIVVTSVNEVFKTTDELDPYYLCLFFMRKEFDRYARFHSWGSARETFVWEDLCDVKIPVPPMNIQKSIADIFKAFQERKKINEQLKQQIKNICPVLIKGAVEEAKRS